MMTKQQFLAPQVVPSGTISGRCVENTLLTLPAHTRDPKSKIACKLKSSHQITNGEPFVLIGFDFASQESQVAAQFAQAFHGGESGSDPLDRALLTGSKENGTDFHSVTATNAGVDRGTAKGVNYSLLYGAGQKTAANTVAQGLPADQKSSALPFAKSIIKSFKGIKNKNTGLYEGGVASDYFNYVYSKSATAGATLDMFGQQIPKCLDVGYIGRSGSPTQI